MKELKIIWDSLRHIPWISNPKRILFLSDNYYNIRDGDTITYTNRLFDYYYQLYPEDSIMKEESTGYHAFSYRQPRSIPVYYDSIIVLLSWFFNKFYIISTTTDKKIKVLFSAILSRLDSLGLPVKDVHD